MNLLIIVLLLAIIILLWVINDYCIVPALKKIGEQLERSEKPEKSKPISPVKPCPHCGSRNVRFDRGYFCKVVCRSCGFFMEDHDFRKALRKWNKAGEP